MATFGLDLRTRRSLVASLPHNACVAEIGVLAGDFSSVIFTETHPTALYLVDCWQTQDAEVYGQDPASANSQAYLDALYKEVCAKFANNREVVVIRDFSIKAAIKFASESLDWVYIDANHLRVREDIEAWWPAVKSGGWITGHDFTNTVGITVKTDVTAFTTSRNLPLFVTTGEGGGIYEVNYPSWAFQKP